MLPLNRSRNRSRFFGLAVPQSSLDLNFLSGTLDPRITFTRASSGTFFGSNGLLQTASNDVPRFDYDPVTLAARGLLIEEQRTNLLTWSENFGDAVWAKTNASVTTNTAVAPDGATTADKLVEDSTTSIHRLNGTASVSAGVVYTTTVFVKASGRTFLYMNAGAMHAAQSTFNLSTGTVAATAQGSAAIISVGDGWYRCSVTGTAATTQSTQVFFQINNAGIATDTSYTGDGTSGILLWGAQLEAGAFPTSYIPTTSATATRAADSALMTGTNFSSWYRQDEGTLLTSFSRIYSGNADGSDVLVSADDASQNNRIQVRLAGDTIDMVVLSGGAIQVDTPGIGVPGTEVRTAAAAYKANDFAFAYAGLATQTDTSGVVPQTNRLGIGLNGANGEYANSYIRRIVYWPVRLTNAQLQALTAS